jgi:lysophospholipase L1-like esterase
VRYVRLWGVLLAAWAIGSGSVMVLCSEEIVVSLPGAPAASKDSPRKAITLCIDDVQGTYTIPYIQSNRELRLRAAFTGPEVVAAELRLLRGNKPVATRQATRDRPAVRFPALDSGEYSLECRGLDRGGRERCRASYDRIGVGTVIAALGDSITEGYRGRGYMIPDLKLSADRFPAVSVSRDGRNFPQFSPTTSHHLPSVNCFESWLTALNNSLADAWRQPVFIANEGWGGISTGGYLGMMQNDAGWKKRMHRLEPQIWLIHLGVNDERANVPAATVRANLAAMVDLLIKEYRAVPSHIFLATPSYDYHPPAPKILGGYAREIAGLVRDRGLSIGPDLFEAFSKDRQRWYGSDPVHPNLEGTARMARLWNEALLKQLPSGPKDLLKEN